MLEFLKSRFVTAAVLKAKCKQRGLGVGGRKNDNAGRIADHAGSNPDGYGNLSSDHGPIGALLPAKPACYTAAREAAAKEGGDGGAAGGAAWHRAGNLA